MINSTDTAADQSEYTSDKTQNAGHESSDKTGAAAAVKTQTSDPASAEQTRSATGAKTQTSDPASAEQARSAAIRERIDDTGFGCIKVIQNKGSGYGVDAVLLAAFAAGETGAKGLKTRINAPESANPDSCRSDSDSTSKKQLESTSGTLQQLRIADLGTGCGIAAFILHHKLGGAEMTGYDVNANAIERARRACEMNGLNQDIVFICTDITDIKETKETIKEICQPAGDSSDRAPAGLCNTYNSYDAVITNPPYFRRTPDEPGAADPNERYIARHETTADISDFARVSAQMLKDGGHLYMVHRPDRLADIICEMRAAGIEPKEMQMVVPSAGKAANIVLIHGIKGAGPELRILPDIAVHTAGGGYTEEILRIYEREN